MKTRLLTLSLVALLSVQPTYAMHIMEGYLPLSWCLFWFAVSLPFVILSYLHIRRFVAERPEARIAFALNTAFVFILSALKLPSLTGSSSHLTGTTLGTLTTGLMSMPLVGFVVLLFQTLLLAHGGISTLGANIFSLAVVGPFVAYLIYQSLDRLGANKSLAIFFAAALGSMATYITTSLQLALVYPDAVGGVMTSFLKFLTIFAYTQVPLCIAEGVITALVMRLLDKSAYAQIARPLGIAKTLALSALAALALALPIIGISVDFGSGTDDQAGEMVMRLAPSHDPSPFFSGYEPSETAEPWLFVLQIAIGLALFAWALWTLKRR